MVSELGYAMPSLCTKKLDRKSCELTFEAVETDNDTLAIQPNSDSKLIDRDAWGNHDAKTTRAETSEAWSHVKQCLRNLRMIYFLSQ